MLFLFVGSFALASIDPVCEDRFVSLMKPRIEHFANAPNRLSIPLTSPEVNQAFELALKAWEKRVDLNRLSRILTRIEGEPLFGEDYLTALKRARNFASVLKSHYQLLSEAHRAPKKLDQFQEVLGGLNDAITNRAGKKEISALARDARRLTQEIPAAIEEAGFRPASLSSLRARLDDIRDTISSITGEQLPTPLTFHLARKAAKELLAFHMSREALEPGSENRRSYEFLFRLNEEMGVLNDDFVRQSMNGEIDYERQKFFLNPKLKLKLRQLEAALAAD